MSLTSIVLSLCRVTWKPLLNSIEQMEFRIFHNIFCTTFQIQKGAFAFDEYISKVFQRYVLELIEIRILDWVYVAIILCINLGRVKLGLHFHSCELHDVACDDRRSIDLFTIVGKFQLSGYQRQAVLSIYLG